MRRLFSGLRFRLVLVLLLAVLPVWLFAFYAADVSRRQAEAAARVELGQTVYIAADRQAQLSEATRQLLVSLAHSPPVLAQDAQSCRDIFADLLARYSDYVNLAAYTPSGDAFCSAVPMPGPINSADLAWFRRAVQTRAFAIGDYQIGRIANQPVLVFAQPAFGADGQLQAVVIASVALTRLNQLAAETPLQAGAVLTIVDRRGTILARSLDAEQWVGQVMPEAPIVQAMLAQPKPGQVETRGIDGVVRLYAFSPVGDADQPGVYVAVGTPRQAALAEAYRLLALSLAGQVVSLLLMLVVVWLGSERFLLREARALVGAARQFSAGQLKARLGPPYSEGELGRLAHAFDDMAGTLQAQFAALSRTQRALRAVSECSQAIVRATEETELFQEVCRIMADAGGYRLAWVGLAEHDANQMVRAVAWAGHEAGYLAKAKITWADTPQGRGPTGTAIRTAKTVDCKNMLTDPAMAPWRENAVQRGYASSIALPLCDAGGGAWGALSIYATEPGAFDAEEVKLLEELAGDLAYGAQALHLRIERDRAQATAQAATLELDRFFNVALDLLCIADTEGYFLRLNPQWEKVLGYSNATMLAHRFIDFVHPDDVDRTLALVGDLSDQKQVWHFENRYRCKDGTYRWLEWNSFPAGTLIYAAVRDITERKEAEAALRASEDKFAKAFRTTPDAVIISRLKDSVFVEVNEGFTLITGYAPEEVVGHATAPGDLDLWVEPEALQAAVAELTAKGEVTERELRFRRKGGAIRIGLMSARLIEVGGEPCTLAITRDITERKEAEAALAQQQYLLTALMDNVPDRIYFKDTASRFIRFNRAFMKAGGITDPAQLTGKTDFDLFTEEHARPAYEDEQAIMRTGKPVVGQEEKETWTDGRVDWVLTTKMPLRDEAGQIIGTFGVTRDITERKQAELALRASEDKFSKAFHTTPDAVLITRLKDGVYLEVNPSFTVLSGYTPEEVLGRPAAMDDWNIWVDAEERAKLVAGLQAQGEATDLEFRFRRKDGAIRTGLMSARFIEIGGEPCVLTIIRDITERKEAEAALRASEDKFSKAFRTTPDSVIITRLKDSIFIEVNDGFTALTGYTPAEVLGRSTGDVKIWVNADERARLMAALQAQGEMIGLEAAFRLKDGTVKTGLISARLIEIGGEPCALAITRDITERKRAEAMIQDQNEQLQAQNQELQAQGAALEEAILESRRLNAELEQRVTERTQELRLANAALVRAARMKDEFLAAMSHELRTPLTGILGLSESLELGIYGPLTDKQVKMVQTVYASGQHLLELINDILDVAKIEAGKVELQPTPVKVSEVCQASMQFVQQLAHKKQLRLAVSQDLAVSVIEADPRRLKQMLVNLLNNAVKFTPEGGAVELKVMGDAAQGVARFIVSDTGIGIAPENLARLFKPFVQLDSRLAREYEGSGLGLALVMGMAELHGGTVQVESELGRGSRFTLVLPWSPEAPAAPAPAEADRAGALFPPPPRRALVIEDAPAAVEQLTTYLNELGLSVTVHAVGQGAVEAAASLKPDVILLDILLPDVSGWEVLRRLKADLRTCQPPVIVASVVDERERAELLGAAGYLSKPVSRVDLQRALSQGLGRVIQRERPVAASPPGSAGEAAKPVVLVADDSQVALSTLNDFLCSRGFSVVTARSGAEALQKASQSRPAIVLMDIQMPGLDGLEAIRRLRADPALAATPVIALTALAMPGDRERCLAAGANEYVTKPVNLEALLGLMEEMVGER